MLKSSIAISLGASLGAGLTHLQEGRPLWVGCAAAVHLVGPVLLMTFAGIGTVGWFRS